MECVSELGNIKRGNEGRLRPDAFKECLTEIKITWNEAKQIDEDRLRWKQLPDVPKRTRGTKSM